MPVYEYGCEAGHRFEVKQKLSDAPLTTCQVCALPVTKLISASGISFKGSGWYVTDYSNKMKQSTPPEKAPSQEKSPAVSGSQNESSAPAGDTKTSTRAAPPPPGSSSSSSGGSAAGPEPSSPTPSGS